LRKNGFAGGKEKQLVSHNSFQYDKDMEPQPGKGSPLNKVSLFMDDQNLTPEEYAKE
jgi:hypothetical protein